MPRLPPDDFAFVAAGDLSPADLARCARGAEAVTREGFSLSVVRSRRDGGAGGLLAWTPQGVVLVGGAAVVEAMLDRAIDVSRGRAPRPPSTRCARSWRPRRRCGRSSSSTARCPPTTRSPP